MVLYSGAHRYHVWDICSYFCVFTTGSLLYRIPLIFFYELKKKKKKKEGGTIVRVGYEGVGARGWVRGGGVRGGGVRGGGCEGVGDKRELSPFSSYPGTNTLVLPTNILVPRILIPSLTPHVYPRTPALTPHVYPRTLVPNLQIFVSRSKHLSIFVRWAL